ncbi:HAD-IA family hydrolase [Sediminibacterium sp. TEGAF015]|uniref:HAD-IA family hydrolase n=1 Tax=Sediminibacterium sp. TEGAF015 TaxID=575378 RepID=UPI00220353D4|nr:HAD-IA family hydrolase [Sediminibacterium sp. TEGAF015]BDQ11711.1 phosphatase [Sediminibacterium sp. TEGAF015]
MSDKYSMVVFDMAGTTVDEDNLVYKLMHQVLVNDGYDCTLDQVLALGAGKEKRQAFKDMLVDLGVFAPENIAKRLHEAFQLNLTEAYQRMEVKPMPYAEKVFDELKKRSIKVVLNTGYDAHIANLLLQKLNWIAGKTIDCLITASDVESSRPDPVMIFLAMKKMGLSDAASIVKVGDSITDIEEGKNAGCGLTIGITTGAQNAKMLLLATPDFVIQGLDEILTIV